MSDLFEKRIRRAELLEKEWPYAAELLRFHRRVWALQKEILALPEKTPILPRLLALVSQDGPPELVRQAKAIAIQEDLLDRYAMEELPPNPALEFFQRVRHESNWISLRASGCNPALPEEQRSVCPGCTGWPLVSVLREDKGAETVRRSLICMRCSWEWTFARVLCPGCGEEKPEKLPRYTAQEIPWMRVEACDTCGKYLKSVDLTLNWDADPIVDELASTPLDVIAREHGYVKIAPNLAGI